MMNPTIRLPAAVRAAYKLIEELHHEVHSLDGHVGVLVRFAPVLRSSAASGGDENTSGVQISADGSSVEMPIDRVGLLGDTVRSFKTFRFKTVLGPGARQGDIYEKVKIPVNAATRGGVSTIAAYGQVSVWRA
jgi:hypothetical protein